ncbi:Gfo/Idh/MocA family oxidoreductase [Thermotalea metallivorans]|uniref:Scyllo-inositol 2-dehydrogenase (NADP(+)) n=1 Tax=Thermotalea metallivorans TaxID=520762 RepID=A0A140L2D6_9FIRM|nr:Gfo/Idh/MocA family oxidoreductase [Thermotalea metallivorans]KXG74711.1 scyllo-inositol 2-dehydrogenase (NADP(+)) [Thermotalea metallivorans]
MKEKVKVGLIGFGLGGRVFHAPVIYSVEHLELAKIVSTREETAAMARQIYPQAVVVPDADKLLEDEEIELVVVATPNTSHFEYASKALLANKHVVVEKPFTITSEEADALIALSQKQNRVLTVHQNRRWDSDFLTVKKIIDSHLLGNVVEYEARFDRFRNVPRPNAWREEDGPGAGVLYDLGSHLIDQAQCLFGLPREVTGDIRIQREGGKVDDYFEITLHYEKTKAILKAGMLVREPMPHFAVMGDRGSFVKYGMDVQEAALKKGCFPKDMEDWGKEPEALWGILNTEINGLSFRGKVESLPGDYRAFYENVYRAIRGIEAPAVKPWEARNTVRIIELAMESSKQKRTLPFC